MKPEETRWDWTFSDTFSVLKKPYAANSKLPMVRSFHQKLFPPTGWKRLVSSKLSYLNLTYQINSLPAARIPYVDSSLPQMEIDRITSDFFWKSSQYRLELFSSSNRGETWTFRNTLPIKRPEGYPIQNIDLLASLGNRARSLPEGTLLALAFRDVGYGVPVFGQDVFTIDYDVDVSELMYPAVPFVSSARPVQYVTQLSQLGSQQFRSICPVRTGRRTATCAYASGTTGAVCTIRYGAPNDTTATQVTVSAGNSVMLVTGYEGEISFSGTGGITSSSLTVTETLS